MANQKPLVIGPDSSPANLQTGDTLIVGNGANLGATAGDISSPNDGDVWYNATLGVFRQKNNGIVTDLGDNRGADFAAFRKADQMFQIY